MSKLSRRSLLAGSVGAAAGVAANVTLAAGRASAAVPAFTSTPFAMGVASGDPFTTSVCLWTRLAPNPTVPGFGMDGQPDTMTVHWRIALTTADLDSDATSVAHGDFSATSFDAHSVHAIASGLTPGTHYYYRFYYTEPNGKLWTSPLGHTRTTPDHSSTETCRFVVISCQTIGHKKLSDGTYSAHRYYNGYKYLVNTGPAAMDIDFVMQIGDYIYADPRIGEETYQGSCDTLEEYRIRHGKYRVSRDNLREMHRLRPFYCSPDDHEWWNNVHGGERNYSTGMVDGHPFRQFNVAIRAYWENMPLRYRPDYDSGTGLRFAHLSRSFQWGSVLFMNLLDGRQFRTVPTTDPNDSSTTMLGIDPYYDHSRHPRQDLLNDIHNSTTTWNCIASQVPMGLVNGTDTWAGYPYERGLITDQLATARANGTMPNAVVVSGDIHVGVVGQVPNKDHTGYVATEFAGPPMTSGDASGSSPNGGTRLAVFKTAEGFTQHGFMLCEATPDHFDASYYVGTNMTKEAEDVTDSSWTVSKVSTWRRVPGTVKPTQI